MSGAMALSIAVQEIFSRSVGDPATGTDTDEMVSDLLKKSEAFDSFSLNRIPITEELDNSLGQLLEYFEVSDSISMLHAARRAKSRVKLNPTAVIEPGSAVLTGVLVIGIILAARVARVKLGTFNIEFYKGVPQELNDLVDTALPKLDTQLQQIIDSADKSA